MLLGLRANSIELLELEFEALKLQKLSDIESIQEKKIPILEYLNADSIKAEL